ncbi:MAG: hypothetical protein ACYC9L_14215 [Sulfuricaulis sp.]
MALTFLVAACDSRSTSKTTAQHSQSTTATAPHPVGATGVPIDPSKKTVHMINAPVRAPVAGHDIVQLQAQHATTNVQLTKLIKNYSENIGNAKKKETLTKEMAKDLETYKHQSLELYKKQGLLSQQQVTNTTR